MKKSHIAFFKLQSKITKLRPNEFVKSKAIITRLILKVSLDKKSFGETFPCDSLPCVNDPVNRVNIHRIDIQLF